MEKNEISPGQIAYQESIALNRRINPSQKWSTWEQLGDDLRQDWEEKARQHRTRARMSED